MKYKIQYIETLRFTEEIEAKNEEEALSIANDRYRDEKIVLDSSDFVGFEIKFLGKEKQPTPEQIKINKICEDIIDSAKDGFRTLASKKIFRNILIDLGSEGKHETFGKDLATTNAPKDVIDIALYETNMPSQDRFIESIKKQGYTVELISSLDDIECVKLDQE